MYVEHMNVNKLRGTRYRYWDKDPDYPHNNDVDRGSGFYYRQLKGYVKKDERLK
jgi:hypothetical protein